MSETMRIEITSPTGIKHAGVQYDNGDIKNKIDAELGRYFVTQGWAKDLDDNVPTGERKPGASTLEVPKTIITPSKDLGSVTIK